MNMNNLNLLTNPEKEQFIKKATILRYMYERSLESDSYDLKYIKAYNDFFEFCYSLENLIPLRNGLKEYSPEYNKMYAGLANTLEGIAYEGLEKIGLLQEQLKKVRNRLFENLK